MESILNELAGWVRALATPAGAWQLVVIVMAGAVAYLAHRRWQQYIKTLAGYDDKSGYRRIALRGSGRVVFPLTAVLVALVAAGILSQFGIKTTLVDLLIPVFLSLAAIRALLYLLRRVYRPSPTLRAMEGVTTTVVWVFVALYLLGWLPDVLSALDKPGLTLGGNRFSLLSVTKFAFAAGAFVILAGWISRQIEQRVTRSSVLSATMRVGLVKFSKVVLYTVALLIALDTVGIDLTTLAVFGGALGVGLGFGLQRIASNFISGFILLFDRSIKPGDVITVGTRFGWVEALYARYIVVRDRDGVETLIPNENLITSEVTNWSYTDRHVRIKLPVQISYSDDPEQAMKIMEGACKDVPRVLEDPAPQARLLQFGDSGINLELRLWLDDPEQGIGNVTSEVNLAIWRGFKEAGVTIPFPQRDVHLKGKPGA